ncbi:MAG: DUF1385 domain-containing protein [Anaerolineae bacterium]|nr:DUF1385 domain-containing protein [Anaerolineae bacterium]
MSSSQLSEAGEAAAAPRSFSYGGQAVIEGVMMRGAYSAVVAVRDPEGQIVLHEQPLNAALYRGPISKIPFVRGLTMLWDALGLGTRALMWSADVALGEEEDVSFNGPLGIGTLVLSLAFGIGLFFLLPAAVSSGLQSLLGLQDDALLTNIIEGLIRLALTVGYIWAIGRIGEIARLFRYHGAEHKTINAYEAGAELTPESAARFSLQHPRCGTGFILVVMVISIFVFSLLGRPAFFWLLVSRVALIPVIAGIAYEFIRFTAARMDKPWIRVLVAPSLALQRLTTNEPDAGMLEVAIMALERVLASEQTQVSSTTQAEVVPAGD